MRLIRFITLLKNGIKIALLFLIFLPALPLEGQRRTGKKIERLEARMARKEKKDYEKRRKTAVEQRYSIQTKEVKERMKESRKKADKYNKGKKDPFFKKLFKRNRKKNHKRKKN